MGVLLSSDQMAPSCVHAGCLQVWAVDTHVSLPHNEAFQRIWPTAAVAFFPQSEKKHVGKKSVDTQPFAKTTYNPKTKSEHQQTVWPTLDEFVSLTGAVQAEALRGIGIYRWQETRRGDKSDTLLSWSQSEVDVKCCWKLFFFVLYYLFPHQELCKPWRKSTIFFLNCCSSETAEWAKHVWSSDLPRTISTPHTFPPSVRCSFARPGCTDARTGLCAPKPNFAHCWHFLLLLFDAQHFPRIRVPTGPRCFMSFSCSVFFPFPMSFPCTPLPGSHSSHLAHRRSTHPHSYLFYHLCLPRRKVNFSGLHFYSSFGPLICISAKKKTSSKAGQATFCILIWVLCAVKTSVEEGINDPKSWVKLGKYLNLLLACVFIGCHSYIYFHLWTWMNVILLWYSQNRHVFILE